MKRVLTVMGVGAVLLGVVLAGQAKPSFAGKWTMVPDASAPAGGPGGMFVSEMTAAQDDKTLTVTSVSQMGEIKTAYNLDGSEGKSPLEFNGTTIDRVTKAAWDGSKLVLTTTSSFNGQAFETRQVWSLGADGNLVVESTRPDFQGGGSPITTKVMYKKS